MKNHADALIFYTAICAEAQIAPDRSSKTACADFALRASHKVLRYGELCQRIILRITEN
ncbi:hypothetical protein [Lachnoclostridium sp. Marseille-P6806]|uniref:hypothetical protein n=1 Tax=Lachnoclostridium sp. Marseille-P6806 TaxID=2364793 RepID=UPI0013EF19F4|nr:hypothetical protein [Lachnoclostridium sp. Marseille-P6806]